MRGTLPLLGLVLLAGSASAQSEQEIIDDLIFLAKDTCVGPQTAAGLADEPSEEAAPVSVDDDVPEDVEAAPEPQDIAGEEVEIAAAALAELPEDEAMRLLVSQLIRKELQGDLGERITRNVRKLVRREIKRSLSSQDLT